MWISRRPTVLIHSLEALPDMKIMKDGHIRVHHDSHTRFTHYIIPWVGRHKNEDELLRPYVKDLRDSRIVTHSILELLQRISPVASRVTPLINIYTWYCTSRCLRMITSTEEGAARCCPIPFESITVQIASFLSVTHLKKKKNNASPKSLMASWMNSFFSGCQLYTLLTQSSKSKS